MALRAPFRLAFVALVATAVAQLQIFSGLNSCGTSCASTVLPNDGCSSNTFSDIECICSSSQFAANGPYSCCVIENCASGLDALEAQAYVGGYCLEYHPVPTSPSCPTATTKALFPSNSVSYSGYALPTGTGYPYSTGGAVPSLTGSSAAVPSISGSFSSGQEAAGTTSSSSGGGGLSTGAIVGIVVGVLGGLLILIGIIAVCLFRRRQKKRRAQEQPYPNVGQQGPSQPFQPQQGPPMTQQQQQQPYGGPQQGPYVGGFAPVPPASQKSQPPPQYHPSAGQQPYHEADSRTMTSNDHTNSTGFSSPSNTYASAYAPPSAQNSRASPFQQSQQTQSAYAAPVGGGGGMVHEAPGANAASQGFAPYKPQETMYEMPGSTQQHG